MYTKFISLMYYVCMGKVVTIRYYKANLSLSNSIFYRLFVKISPYL